MNADWGEVLAIPNLHSSSLDNITSKYTPRLTLNEVPSFSLHDDSQVTLCSLYINNNDKSSHSLHVNRNNDVTSSRLGENSFTAYCG